MTTTTTPMTGNEPTTRDRLLAAACEVFVRKGYRARVQDIARTAGFTAGALYVHFANRIDLIEEALLLSALGIADRVATGQLTELPQPERIILLEAVALLARTSHPIAEDLADVLADPAVAAAVTAAVAAPTTGS